MHDDSLIIYLKKTPTLHRPQYHEVICTVQSLKTLSEIFNISVKVEIQ